MWVRGIAGVVLLIVGVVWVAQGVGVLHGSPMTGQAVWAVLGAPLAVIGLALLRSTRRARRRGASD